MKFLHCLFITLIAIQTPVWAELTPDEIVAKVDTVRNVEADHTMMATVTSYKPNRAPRVAKYEVMVKGVENTIVKTLEPQTERGRSMLMRGPDFWAFFPEVAKPLRISLQEKLTGDVSNGDIARTNFSGDYAATLLRDEEINGKKHYVLELKSKKDTSTYGKVILWAEHDTFGPFKAEFYALSGRFLKTCSYEEYEMIAGQMRPSLLVLTDAVLKGQYSTIKYGGLTEGEIPEKYFSKEYLKKLAY